MLLLGYFLSQGRQQLSREAVEEIRENRQREHSDLVMKGYKPHNKSKQLTLQPDSECDSAKRGRCCTDPIYCQFCCYDFRHDRGNWGFTCSSWFRDQFEKWRDTVGVQLLAGKYYWETGNEYLGKVLIQGAKT